MLGISRAAYYRWLSGKKCTRELENEKIAEIMEQIHTDNPDKGYRRIKDDLAHDHNLNVNEKRVLEFVAAWTSSLLLNTRMMGVPDKHPTHSILQKTY